MSEKVLVTGANGFVGNHVVHELASHGYEVVAAGGRSGTDAPEGAGQYFTVDLSDPHDVADKIDFRDITGVIHLAGLAAVGPSFSNPELYMTSNPGFQNNLFARAREQNATPRFVIISSGAVYGKQAPAELPVRETSELRPDSPYAESKIAQEHSALESGFDCIIARPFNHIGPGQSGGFLVPDITKQLIAAERGTTKSVSVGNLEAKRDYTDVRDIASAYRMLLDKGRAGEIYNICSGVSHSGQEILETLLSLSGTDVKVERDPSKMRPSDTPDVYGSAEKIIRDTEWRPTYDLKQSLQDALEDWRQRAD